MQIKKYLTENNQNYENVTIALFCYHNDLNINTKHGLKRKLLLNLLLNISYKHKPHLEIRILLKDYLQIDVLYLHKMR